MQRPHNHGRHIDQNLAQLQRLLERAAVLPQGEGLESTMADVADRVLA